MKRYSISLLALLFAIWPLLARGEVYIEDFGTVLSSDSISSGADGVFLSAGADNMVMNDTVSNERTDEKLEEFDREIESIVFVPKGQWITGISVSYSQTNQNRYQFFILENLSGDTYTFKVSPMLLFAFKKDMAAGGKFEYTRSLAKLETADFVLDPETGYDIDRLYRLSHNYYATGMLRMYFSIGKSRRFGFFNEIQLKMGGGQTKLSTGAGKSLSGSYERNFTMNVGIVPGLSVFLNNYSAMEVNVGVLGFNYTSTKAVKDQIYVSHRNSKSANFRINLFSITFGVSFYL